MAAHTVVTLNGYPGTIVNTKSGILAKPVKKKKVKK